MTVVITYTQGSGPSTVTYRNMSSEAEAKNKFLNDRYYSANSKTKIEKIVSYPG